MKAKETFYAYKVRTKLGTAMKIREYLAGKTIEIITLAGGHNYGQPGDKVKLDNPGMRTTSTGLSAGVLGGNTISFTNFRIIDLETREQIREYIKDIEENIEELKTSIKYQESKIEYLDETKGIIFDENEFKAFSVLSMLDDSSTTKLEKAKLISGLMN